MTNRVARARAWISLGDLASTSNSFGAVLALAAKVVFRFEGRKKDALRSSEEATVPPKRLEAIKKEFDWSSSILPNQVTI